MKRRSCGSSLCSVRAPPRLAHNKSPLAAERRRRRDRRTLREKNLGTNDKPLPDRFIFIDCAFRLSPPPPPPHPSLPLCVYFCFTSLGSTTTIFSLLADRTHTSKIPAEREDAARKISREWLIHRARNARGCVTTKNEPPCSRVVANLDRSLRYRNVPKT